MNTATASLALRTFLLRWVPLLLLTLAAAGARAQPAQADPPGRVATLSHTEGSVVFAPAGEQEWSDAVRNRPITRGDRLWTDDGARAEVHMGSAALHMDGRTFLEMIALDDEVLQMRLNEGAVNARVRQLAGGENFEINTPQLAFRATQPGDFRIDVDAARGTTRVVVHSGTGVAYGAGGGALHLQAGQQMAFAGRDLALAPAALASAQDGFDRWAQARNRAEDDSIAARFVPRDVVGYQQLDANGTWAQDADYGPVWYPRVTVADWAPYRYGRWDWVAPWGWTWIDDAPWGFAPFHYGRWAEIGSRWAWVPGRLGPRPVYAPALVAFVGGGNWSLSVGSGMGIGWYPLGPGEAWQPFFRASPVYVSNVNRYVGVNGRYPGARFYQRRPESITTVRLEDFSRGRPVHNHWSRMNPADAGRVQSVQPPPMPENRRWAGNRAGPAPQRQAMPVAPPVQAVVPQIAGRPQPPWQERRAQEDQRRQQQAQQALQTRQLQIQQAQQQQQAQQAQQIAVQRQREVHERQQQAAAAREAQRQQAWQHQQQRELAVQQQQQQQVWQQQPRAAMQQRQPPQAAAPVMVAPVPGQHAQARGEERGWRGRPQRDPQRDERAAERSAQPAVVGEDEGGRGRGRGHRSN